MIGQSIAHYRVTAKLGAGGMGEVYRAHDEQLDRDVALKVLPADTFSDPAARARLLREARSAAGLNHPHICTIYEVGEAAGQAFIAMELVEGRPLSALLADGPLPAPQILRFGVQMADALAHAHEHAIVHRDLKSANIVVTPEGRTKILDFGLAKRLDEDALDEVTRSQASLTTPGAVVGTLAYMAPEQLCAQPADARSDVWALGVVLYELAGGARPFQGKTGFELSSSIIHRPPDPLPDTVPTELRSVIGRCLEKAPEQRYQRGGEVRAALEAIQTGAALEAARRARILRLLWRTAAIAVLLLVILATVFGWRSFRQGRLGTPASARMESLAVLPLENLSGDPTQDYLASGIHEALITDLAKLSGFHRVIARSSVKRYEKTTMSPKDIARELGVDALLTGTVLRSGNRIQITAHLLNSAEEQIWSERYDREFRDVLSVQNEIVSALTREIKLQLTVQERARLTTQRPIDAEAFEAYLRGRYHAQKQTRDDLDMAERNYQLALQKDPNYALAWAGLGNLWLARGDVGIMPPSEAFPKGTAYLEKALALDDSIADLHVSLANHKNAIQWDWPAAEKEFKRALELNPNLADAHFFYADMLITTKRNAEWETEIKRARELDPLNDFNESFYGWHMNYLHRYDEAIPIFQRMLATGPNKGSNYLGLWGAYFRKGMYDEALAAARNYFAVIGEKGFADTLGTGHGEAAYRAAMRRVGNAMAAQSKQRHLPAIRIARMYAHAGDTQRALDWLETAHALHESPMIRIAVFWDWDDLRATPRFQDLLRRMNLPQ